MMFVCGERLSIHCNLRVGAHFLLKKCLRKINELIKGKELIFHFVNESMK